MEKEFEFGNLFESENNCDDIKHFLSADTAIDSSISRRRQEKNLIKPYFVLDPVYVQLAYHLVISELEKVVQLKEDEDNLLEDSLDRGRWEMTFNPT